MSESKSALAKPASQLIDERIAELGDWRGEHLALVRKLIKEAIPQVVEEWKWRGVPVWSDNGIICTGESYKNYIKLTFAKGASLADAKGLFNSSLDGNTRRAIDISQNDKIDPPPPPPPQVAFKALIKEASALNAAKKKK